MDRHKCAYTQGENKTSSMQLVKNGVGGKEENRKQNKFSLQSCK